MSIGLSLECPDGMTAARIGRAPIDLHAKLTRYLLLNLIKTFIIYCANLQTIINDFSLSSIGSI